MSTVYVCNMTDYSVQLIVNDNYSFPEFPPYAPAQGPQPIGFSYSGSGGGSFAAQNQVQIRTVDDLEPVQSGSFSIDPNLPNLADVQISIYQGFLSVIEPSGVHMITLRALPPPPVDQ